MKLFGCVVSLYSAVGPLFYVARILGAAPMTTIPGNLAQKYQLSWKWISYSAALMLLFLGYSFCHPFYLHSTGPYSRNMAFAVIIQMKHGLLMFLAVYYHWSRSREVLALMAKIDESFLHNRKAFYQRAFILIFLKMFFLLVLKLSLHICLEITLMPSSTGLPNTVYSCYSQAFLEVLMLEFTTLVLLLKQRLSELNEQVQCVIEVCRAHPYRVRAAHLRCLMDFHEELCRVCELINSRFEAQMLVIFTVYFGFLVTYVSSEVHSLLECCGSGCLMPEKLLLIIYITSDHLSQMSAIILFCGCATREAARLRRLLLTLDFLQVPDPCVARNVQRFLTQASAGRIRFSVYGLFELKGSTIFSALNMAISYIIILIQAKRQ
ncbi:uncharacterized protein LOC134539645 [Bacillus rossius redtenbacheri]|uniref:uncharacterized protein LOC134539645 n=1 Tax=Bacillus rossius redtenbacheri TaxID=93214 RepID=UPI002FDD8FB7